MPCLGKRPSWECRKGRWRPLWTCVHRTSSGSFSCRSAVSSLLLRFQKGGSQKLAGPNSILGLGHRMVIVIIVLGKQLSLAHRKLKLSKLKADIILDIRYCRSFLPATLRYKYHTCRRFNFPWSPLPVPTGTWGLIHAHDVSWFYDHRPVKNGFVLWDSPTPMEASNGMWDLARRTW